MKARIADAKIGDFACRGTRPVVFIWIQDPLAVFRSIAATFIIIKIVTIFSDAMLVVGTTRVFASFRDVFAVASIILIAVLASA